MTSPTDQRARATLQDLERRHLLRRIPVIERREGVNYLVDGEPVVGFCSNDYLGYASAPPITARHPHYTTDSGAGASRLICGDLQPHRELEKTLAAIARTDDSVLFVSGFQLNVGVLPALLREHDAVYSDRLIHASLIDGLRLSKPQPQILPHLNAPPKETHDVRTPQSRLRWWVCESLYSMNGTRHAPRDLTAWTNDGNALYLDGAHDFGLFQGGTGWAQAEDINATLYMGTLGKAYGAAGAFLAASKPICDWVRNTARSFIFSTAMSPLVAVHLLDRIEAVQGDDGDRRRAALTARIHQMSELLELPINDAIIPLAVGDPSLALSFSQQLRGRGWHVQAIRPPTVPNGTSRLRLTLSAAHTAEHVEHLAVDLRALFRRVDHPLRLAAST